MATAANNNKKGWIGKFKDFFSSFLKKNRFTRRKAVSASMDWYRNRIRIATGQEISTKGFATVADIREGGVFQYVYDPKHRDTLPYYDKFPLIIPIEMTKNGWLGLNLHYLPPQIRAVIFDDILKYAVNGKTRMMVAYEWVVAYSRYPIIQHCIKRYLITHVTSPVVSIPEEEWLNCVLLPSQTFMKKSDEYVWADGRRKYGTKRKK